MIRGGSSESEVNELTVIPWGPRASCAVTRVTPLAHWRIHWRRSSLETGMVCVGSEASYLAARRSVKRWTWRASARPAVCVTEFQCLVGDLSHPPRPRRETELVVRGRGREVLLGGRGRHGRPLPPNLLPLPP